MDNSNFRRMWEGIFFILFSGLVVWLLIMNIFSKQGLGFRNTQETISSNIIKMDIDNNRVGIVSTTPMARLSIGTGGTVTSTISVGKFCMYAGQENGINVYIILGSNQPATTPFVTTTVSCF